VLIDRSHIPWGIFSGIVLTAGAILYAVCAAIAPHGPSGGTVPGLCFGIIATAMMTFSVLLAARKAFRTRRAGSASFWMKGHIWLGSLSVPFLLFHSGFSWGGTISGLLWMCVLFVVGSGLLALLLQQILPAILRRNTPAETLEGQSFWQRERLLMIADIRLCHLCGHQSVGPAAELSAHCRKLVSEYDLICTSTSTRSEQAAGQMRLLRSVMPIDLKEYFWSLAKFTKNELRIITTEAEFPKLLAATYPSLRETHSHKSAAINSVSGSAETVAGLHPPKEDKRPVPTGSSVNYEREQLWKFYTDSVRPFLATDSGLHDSSGRVPQTVEELERLFNRQRESLPDLLQGPLNELHSLCISRQAMARQGRFFGWMNTCMLLHVPVSIMLIVFLMAHIVMSLRVVPF
jgi:hypothetical protein